MANPSEKIVLTRRQIREVDRMAIEEYGIPGIVLMENASRSATKVVLDCLEGSGTVAIVCGRGNNGGDGFAVARHLANAGVAVELLLACDPEGLTGDAATNYGIARKMAIKCHAFDTIERIRAARPALDTAAVVVDAVLGTGFSGEVRSPLDAVINAINEARGAKIVAIDVPSGLDCDTGRPCNATIRADVTVTFVARKAGFDAPGASDYTGPVHVADIGAPSTLPREVLSADGAG
ncbi:MAG: NAD(P)H-hydrate epimerase [Phycisphaerae bacterium]|nr:NAD(P)H-hydrate epimerase [Phycisphaerae bacterium]